MDPLGRCDIAGIAVVERVADERAGSVEPAHVDAPRVDADAPQAGRGADCSPEPVEDFVVQAQGVPMQPVRELDGLVGEPVDLVERKALRTQSADDDSAARGAEVDRCDDALVHRRNGARPRRPPGRCDRRSMRP